MAEFEDNEKIFENLNGEDVSWEDLVEPEKEFYSLDNQTGIELAEYCDNWERENAKTWLDDD